MSPLRKIDRLVAEKVMGWQEFSGIGFPGHCPCFRVTHNGYIEKVLRPTDDGWIGSSWRPTEDIAAAWDVVEKLTETDRVTIDSMRFEAKLGCAAWDVEVSGARLSTVRSPTAPLSICLAALKAKGVEVPP